MLKVIRSLLLKIVDDIDAGNSNITEGEAIEIVDNLRRFTDKEKRLSKYAACEYLNVSRATFDNYVREGKLPRGKHEIGFKELSWNKKTLKSLAKMSESLKRGYSEFPERREKIRNKALGRKMPKDTRCKISLNHSKSNLLKINDEVGSIRYWALKIGKAHSVLSYRLKVHGIDNLRKYIEQRIKLV